MKGGEIATCPTFHMGKGQCLTRVNAIVIDNSLEKKKNQKTKNKPGFWVLVTSNRRRKEQNGKMEGGRRR